MTKRSLISFETQEPNPDIPNVLDVIPEELALLKDQVLLVDVRQPEEFTGELGHVPGSRLLVLNTLPEHLNELPKDETIVFICRSGARSARAAAFALENGFEHVYNMKGGMIRWNFLNLPVEGRND